MTYKPSLNRPYRDEDLQLILDEALCVLEKIGIGCSEPGAVERVTAERGIFHDGGRLKFDPATLMEHVERVRERNAARPDEEPEFELLASWSCLNYADPETGEVRPPTTEDTIQMTRFADARGGREWSVPLVPADVPPQHATLTGEYVAAKHSRALGGFMSVQDPREIEFLIDMYQAVGRTYLFVEQISISPLRFNDAGLGMALRFTGRDDVRVILAGAIPTVGSTAPLSLRTAMVQAVAESLALSLTSTRMELGEGGFGAVLMGFDMQHATLGFGTSEEVLLYPLRHQVTSFLNGTTYRIGTMHSLARQPDAQAATSRTLNALGQALVGARRFRGGGQLAMDEVFSPQQAVIDDEILAHVAHVMRGVNPLAADGDVVEELSAGLETNQYLDAPATVEHFREFYLFPELFRHCNTDRWRSEGCPTVLADAWEKAQAQIASCDFQLSDDQARDLDAVYQRALEEMG